MSGKPGTPAASRAGVPGASRVLVYVADPRQLEPGVAAGPDPPPQPSQPDTLYLHDNLHHHILPRNTVYRTQVEQNDQRNQNTLYYKSANDSEGKISNGPADNPPAQGSEYYHLNSKDEESRAIDQVSNISVKRNSINSDYSVVEGYGASILPDGGELTYQTRCPAPTAHDNMQSIVLHHDQSQYNEDSIANERANCGERSLSMDKSYVNYQFLEQSASHQSIVNQSISILNQQVGVNRGIVGEVEGGSAPQLVHTADGVVLAVLPPPVLPHPIDNTELSLRTTQSDSPKTVTVPLGWQRIVNSTSVLYISPSGSALSTLAQLLEYLQTAGTCKCGLPCPLRPETAFSFDPKVISKPYQAASGVELTKLCNHKRKLLATLQARAQSPATPPPPHMDQKKVAGTEVAMLKKKTKKRAGFPPNMSVSQLMVQRERPLNEFKSQDGDLNRTVSPGTTSQRINSQPQSVYVNGQQNLLSQDNEIKHETHMQRTSHYLTVNSGWITQQQENIESVQKGNNQNAGNTVNGPLNVGMPVLGTNGQIIGVNTGYNKQNAYKNIMNITPHNIMEQEQKDEKKEVSLQQNIHHTKQSSKEEESQIFCGLNQPLTQEVMQKINEQQQIFIQQNQKQIEMAMKGFRNQLVENPNAPKSQSQSQYVPQGQLVIQNGAVVKTNPAKTPPWQVKRNDSLTCPSPKPQKPENIDYEELNMNLSEESSSSSGSFHNNENLMNQAMCSRVPPLPQHYGMMSQQWSGADINKKKVKINNNKGTKKKSSPTENKMMALSANSMRTVHESKGKVCDNVSNNSGPSFMEDPSGFLAQQTVLLNNTISRQVGINSSYEGKHYDSSNNSANAYGQQINMEKLRSNNKSCDTPNMYRNNMVPNPSPSPNTTPDSSILLDKGPDNSMSQCYKGCNSTRSNNTEFDNNMRMKYMKHNMFKMETEGNRSVSSLKHGFDDNPVTSSTFLDRNTMLNEHCSPIQAGTVSTSNVSPIETLQPPELSPTPSNSSRSTDTPHSGGNNNSQMQQSCSFPMPSPAYSNPGSCRDHFNSNPSTPGSNQSYHYSSPGPPTTQTITGSQMLHFISNHNVNKNLMEVDNISMVGVKPNLRDAQEMFVTDPSKRMENTMPGYCPPPHLGGGPAHSLIQACYVQTFITTMASGFSVTRDTVTSVLAGRAKTATTSINASQANFIRPPPPPSVNLATTYAIPNNQPDPFINSVNLPTSYPLHIAGTTAQNMISKSPLEMVQHVMSSLPSKTETGNVSSATLTSNTREASRRTIQATNSGQILISSTGQIIMPPPPPKVSTAISPGQGSASVTNVTASMTHVVPAVGGVSPIVNQSTVVVNTLPAPFVIQPPIMAVDGQVVQQNTVLPQIMTGSVVPGHSPGESSRQMEVKSGQNFVQGVAMLSPESLKKRNKKKKNQTTNITNVLQITAPQQNSNNIVVHHSSPQQNSNAQFSPRGFQLSPNNNISSAPMLQALTIVPGKSGTPAHIVMNGQNSTSNFGSQQIITNTSPSQQINLLQPVNLINNASNVMSNFPAFQQFIVPNLGGMMMTADGATIIQDNSNGMPMQLQLQTVNGQNVLTPVQNAGMFATGANGGVVIRAQNQQGKIIQSQHSPGAQFLPSNNQVMMNSPNFNGQLSPLLANLSPPNVTFNTSPHQVRSGNVQTQEYIQQTNQMGQTLMVPLSPKQASMASATTRSNSTFVQQNTTIVQQQTTLVSNSHNVNPSRLLDANVLTKQVTTNQKGRFIELPPDNEEGKEDKHDSHVRQSSVSTQTLVNQQATRKSPSDAVSGSSPPDTTTHSPLGADAAASPRVYPARCLSTQANYADTTTKSPEPADLHSSAMVQCVSSSEPDVAEWAAPRGPYANVNNAANNHPHNASDTDAHNVIPNMSLLRQNRTQIPIESSELHYGQNLSGSHSRNNQQNNMSMTQNYYDRSQYKRKNDFGDGSTYRSDKIMRTNYGMVHGLPKESEYDPMGIGPPDKTQRHFAPSGTSTDSMQKVFDRRNIGSGNDEAGPQEGQERGAEGEESGRGVRRFSTGDVVWGPVKGYASWPGKLEARCGGGWRVRWFGGERPPSVLHHERLLTLSEGLEAHHAARTKHRKSRKLNTLLENAIQEAMAELDKKSEATTSSNDVIEDVLNETSIIETPKRTTTKKEKDKVKSKDRHRRKSPVKIAPNPNKPGDGARLRSSR